MDERTQKLLEQYKTSGPLTTQQIGDVFKSTPANTPTLSTITTPAPTPTNQTAPTLPTPTAPTTYESYFNSVSEQQKTAQASYDKVLADQKAEVDRKLEEAKVTQQGYLANIDPATRPTYDQEMRVMQNELDASESASKTLQTNFEANQKLVNELDSLLTKGQAEIQRVKSLPVSQSVGQKMLYNTSQDVAARTGVIQAVMAARNNQINQAYNMINQAKDTVAANWNDQLQYYGTLLDLNYKDIVSLDAESKAIAEEQKAEAKKGLDQLDATANYIKEIMISPETAQFMFDAGVSLTDSIETINQKMAEQTKREEVKNTSNELVSKGYEPVGYNAPGSVPIQAGGQTMYFKPPVKATTGGSFTAQEQRKLEQAGLVDASRQEQLDYLYGKSTTNFTSTQINKGAVNAGLEIDLFDSLPDDVKNYYVNMTPSAAQSLKDTLAQVANGEMDAQEVKDYIKNKGVSPAVSSYLNDLIDAATPEPKTSFWSNAWSTIKSLWQ